MSTPLRVMVIVNSLADAELELKKLRQTGFQCLPGIISGRAEFLDELERFPYDIVLSDYPLPGWNGMDAFLAMRELGHDVPFILVCDAASEETAVECVKAGVTDYIVKDHLARLPLAVARALEEASVRNARGFIVEALRQSEANSLFLFAHNPLSMWVITRPGWQFLQVNDAAIEHYGYSRADFLKMKACDLHPDKEIPRLIAVYQDDSRQMEQAGQWRHRRKDGSLIDVEMSFQKMEFCGQAAALVVAQDITVRKRTEEEKQKFFTLVENSRDFIAVADLNDNVEYVNPAGRELLGIPNVEAVRGSHSIDYIIPDDLPLVYDTILPTLKSNGHWEGVLRFRHRETGKALPMDFVGFQVKDLRTGRPRFVATVSRDMSERYALEQQLQHAQKFEAIGRLAGGIAHDFNNVISAIVGWAELGEEQTLVSGDPASAYFKKIHVQCDRVTSLIHQLLAFARKQILERRSLNLNETVTDVLSLLDTAIGDDIEVRTVLAKDLRGIRADPTQIEQVLVNLCVNSRDAMPKGGRLTIQTRNAEFPEIHSRSVASCESGHYAELRVTDTGVGMDAAVQERIFEPFFSTKGTRKGTGLGLATVYGIVKQHGGTIDVESKPGLGSTFHIFLPIDESPAKTEFVHPVPEEQPVRGGTETILIADDHEGSREMAQAVLKALGYRILLARDGEEAIAMFADHCDTIALVLVDVVMPGRSGPEVCAAITKMKAGISVMFATGYSDENDSLTGLAESGAAILRKPYTAKSLCRRIREVLDRAAPAPKLQI